MTIANMREKCKKLLERVPADWLVLAVVVAAAILSFGLGYLAGRDTRAASILTVTVPAETARNGAVGEPYMGRVIASKNGSKFYTPDCAGAGRISDANKIWFTSPAAAREAGYSPAANCDGI